MPQTLPELHGLIAPVESLVQDPPVLDPEQEGIALCLSGAALPEAEPKHDWPRHAYRILNIVDNRARSLRKRQLIGSFKAGLRKGTY